jgi:hypothetical protein
MTRSKCSTTGGAGEEGSNDGAPLRERIGLAKTDRVVLQRVPENLQNIAIRAFKAPVDLVALATLGVAKDGAQAALDGFFKCRVLAGWMRMSASSRIMEGSVGMGMEQGVNGNGLGLSWCCYAFVLTNPLQTLRLAGAGLAGTAGRARNLHHAKRREFQPSLRQFESGFTCWDDAVSVARNRAVCKPP